MQVSLKPSLKCANSDNKATGMVRGIKRGTFHPYLFEPSQTFPFMVGVPSRKWIFNYRKCDQNRSAKPFHGINHLDYNERCQIVNTHSFSFSMDHAGQILVYHNPAQKMLNGVFIENAGHVFVLENLSSPALLSFQAHVQLRALLCFYCYCGPFPRSNTRHPSSALQSNNHPRLYVNFQCLILPAFTYFQLALIYLFPFTSRLACTPVQHILLCLTIMRCSENLCASLSFKIRFNMMLSQ